MKSLDVNMPSLARELPELSVSERLDINGWCVSSNTGAQTVGRFSRDRQRRERGRLARRDALEW